MTFVLYNKIRQNTILITNHTIIDSKARLYHRHTDAHDCARGPWTSRPKAHLSSRGSRGAGRSGAGRGLGNGQEGLLDPDRMFLKVYLLARCPCVHGSFSRLNSRVHAHHATAILKCKNAGYRLPAQLLYSRFRFRFHRALW